MRILIVEDDQLIIRALRKGLRSSYAVDVARTGKDGLHKAEQTAYDVILLDLNLPDITGEEILSSLRENSIDIPVLILTGRHDEADKVRLLDLGAGDYITKPFSLEEVKARIRVALRNTSKSVSSVLTIGDLRLDTAARTVRHCDQPITLRRKEFDLLEYFMRNPGQTLSRSMILEHIWDMSDNVWANVVDVHVKHLRDKIDRPFGHQLIKTVHGVGYKLEINESA